METFPLPLVDLGFLGVPWIASMQDFIVPIFGVGFVILGLVYPIIVQSDLYTRAPLIGTSLEWFKKMESLAKSTGLQVVALGVALVLFGAPGFLTLPIIIYVANKF